MSGRPAGPVPERAAARAGRPFRARGPGAPGDASLISRQGGGSGVGAGANARVPERQGVKPAAPVPAADPAGALVASPAVPDLAGAGNGGVRGGLRALLVRAVREDAAPEVLAARRVAAVEPAGRPFRAARVAVGPAAAGGVALGQDPGVRPGVDGRATEQPLRCVHAAGEDRRCTEGQCGSACHDRNRARMEGAWSRRSHVGASSPAWCAQGVKRAGEGGANGRG